MIRVSWPERLPDTKAGDYHHIAHSLIWVPCMTTTLNRLLDQYSASVVTTVDTKSFVSPYIGSWAIYSWIKDYVIISGFRISIYRRSPRPRDCYRHTISDLKYILINLPGTISYSCYTISRCIRYCYIAWTAESDLGYIWSLSNPQLKGHLRRKEPVAPSTRVT